MDKNNLVIYGLIVGIFGVYAYFAKYCVDRYYGIPTKKDIELAKVKRDITNNYTKVVSTYNNVISKITEEESE